MNGHSASSAAQHYGVKPDPMEGISGMHRHSGPDIPLPQKPSTTGSVNQRIASRSPSGAALSSQSMGSTLFDQPSSAAQMPRPEGS